MKSLLSEAPSRDFDMEELASFLAELGRKQRLMERVMDAMHQSKNVMRSPAMQQDREQNMELLQDLLDLLEKHRRSILLFP
jgi:uncharacterized protein with von Willebrand factor type A (vWA) domain